MAPGKPVGLQKMNLNSTRSPHGPARRSGVIKTCMSAGQKWKKERTREKKGGGRRRERKREGSYLWGLAPLSTLEPLGTPALLSLPRALRPTPELQKKRSLQGVAGDCAVYYSTDEETNTFFIISRCVKVKKE